MAGLAALSDRGVSRSRILVVDDDPQTLRYVRDALSRAGYSPTVTANPDEVPRLMGDQEPELVLLDLMLPGTDGIVLMRSIAGDGRCAGDLHLRLRPGTRSSPGLSRWERRTTWSSRFRRPELVARIQAALRRQSVPVVAAPGEPYLFGDLSVDYFQRRVTVAGIPVDLTDIEYRMLAELSANANRVLTHEQLRRQVWGQEGSADSGPVRAIVRRLRRKLGDDAENPTYIFNKRRVGYWMEQGEGQEREPLLTSPVFLFRQSLLRETRGVIQAVLEQDSAGEGSQKPGSGPCP